jgi:serine/threonine-protein kinase
MAADLGRLLAGSAPDAGIAGAAMLGAAAAAPTAIADPTQTMPAAGPPPPPLEESTVIREEPQRSRAGRAILITLSVLLLLSLGAFALYQLLSPDGQTAGAIKVPSVIGSTRADAEAELRGANLVPEFENVRGEDDDTVGQAVKQTPIGTTEVEPQSVVTVEINVGPATAKIPNGLVGEDVDKVTKKLEKAGFTSVQTEPVEVPPGDADKDEVLSIDPDEGESVALDEDIVVRFAREKKDDDESASPTPEPSDTSEPTSSSEPSASEDKPTKEPTSSSKPTPKPTKTSASEAPTETPGSGEGPTAGEGPSEGEQ